MIIIKLVLLALTLFVLGFIAGALIGDYPDPYIPKMFWVILITIFIIVPSLMLGLFVQDSFFRIPFYS